MEFVSQLKLALHILHSKPIVAIYNQKAGGVHPSWELYVGHAAFHPYETMLTIPPGASQLMSETSQKHV